MKDFGNHVVLITTWNWKTTVNCQKNINYQKYMAVKNSKKKNVLSLPLETEIEVIAICEGKKPVKQVMTYGEALKLKKSKGWNYRFYQFGFSQFKTD